MPLLLPGSGIPIQFKAGGAAKELPLFYSILRGGGGAVPFYIILRGGGGAVPFYIIMRGGGGAVPFYIMLNGGGGEIAELF